MSQFSLALFDVDGVLLDSLTPHLKICQDKSREYGLGLQIPSSSQFKQMVRTGTRISPMYNFFLAVGFPEEFAAEAYLQYRETFMQVYKPTPFPGVHQTLKALHGTGIQLGIVTSNFLANVVKALGDSFEYFHPKCIYTKESVTGESKSESIASAMTTLAASRSETIYIGDQPEDWKAAITAGVHFLGVTYGWGISEEDDNFPTVGDVSGIYAYLTSGSQDVDALSP
jgi:phosphoglycolate phosphatase